VLVLHRLVDECLVLVHSASGFSGGPFARVRAAAYAVGVLRRDGS
jgi:hypothetical protein